MIILLISCLFAAAEGKTDTEKNIRVQNLFFFKLSKTYFILSSPPRARLKNWEVQDRIKQALENKIVHTGRVRVKLLLYF